MLRLRPTSSSSSSALISRLPSLSQTLQLNPNPNHSVRRHKVPLPCSSIISRSKTKRAAWPTVHPKKTRLKQIKNVLGGKDINASLGPALEPTKNQLYVVALHQAIPFVGFGIMDNAILLLAGEAIDVYLGVALGISTMCAAAIGNIISDLCGVVFGTMIEDALLGWSKKIEKLTNGKVRLPPMPQLTYEQRNLRSVRWSSQMGCAVGLTVGCIIGMFPLLFFPADERALQQQSKKENEEGDEGKNKLVKSATSNNKLLSEQNVRLKEEIRQWKSKNDEIVERLEGLEKEKNDGLWDRGY